MKYLLFLAIKSQGKKARGFTLIELLVVVVILGVLGAVGLPNLLRQVSKAREAEAIAILGQINRAQQAYRYENGTFARLEQLPISGINNAKFYTFVNHFDPTALQSSYRAGARPPFGNEIRNYAGGVRLLEDGRLGPVICEAKGTSEDLDDVFVNTSGGCENSITLNDLSAVQQDTP
ncbi:prepilin-type N-terminal cleavage/methylation domain-containing protein [Microcystis aeruginosa BLCCF158]|uniref:Prepilin-type N-terminal cleavage/methylation domain-containing protein n=1 Tax=Microcystis aeruginosa BLCC-F158 TaxID=2755316 RepID=A0A841V525_MICAE|nr:type IV pilin-like G/H family protein [Microcystis aeruginosa]MBC1197822.1 prepilin-type N-terminal cleavage/methylation domain-containing protein [Microcystis aeruginosa BLCC-F158]